MRHTWVGSTNDRGDVIDVCAALTRGMTTTRMKKMCKDSLAYPVPEARKGMGKEKDRLKEVHIYT